ncbi:MAG TPA: hypothetical protein VJ276_19035 [Thermoanaerobaculia bacterium]|nr:hypothetical protein [Thermoanaerobaculia bacterium]
MSALGEAMEITYRQLADTLRERLRERLERAARLRCAEHGQPVVAVTIHGRENGWFDSVWTTCCSALETQAGAIVKRRC